MTTSKTESLDRLGYVVLEDVVSPQFVDSLNNRIDQLFELEGEQAGSEFKREAGCRRLANLVNKGESFQEVICHSAVLEHVGHVLGDFKLSSLNVREVNSMDSDASPIRQPLHSDMGAVPDERGAWVCNALWMLQDITVENGPLRVVPGTHRTGLLPSEAMDDPTADHEDQVLITGRAGTVVIFNAHLWHGGMENRSGSPRRALHAFYCRRDKPQQQYQKSLLDAELQGRLSPELRQLLALDDRLNDELSSRVHTTSGFMK